VSPGLPESRSSRLSDTAGRRGRGRGTPRRPSPAALGVIRVDPDFAEEFPDGDATSTEAHVNLARTGAALLLELDRCVSAAFDMPQAAATALAVIDGAAAPLTPSQIGDRVLVPSATMTSTLDLLEGRGWVVRTPNPEDRRSLLVNITPEGRAAANRILAGIRKVEVATLSGLTLAERKQLLGLLAKVLERAAVVASDPPITLDGRRNRPKRLDQHHS
jgi:DNA-binding MarR family transcriptional regulator